VEGAIQSQNSDQTFSDIRVTSYPSVIELSSDCGRSPKSTFGSGDFRKHKEDFFPIKVSGDTSTEINNPDTGVNFRNGVARKILSDRDRDNE